MPWAYVVAVVDSTGGGQPAWASPAHIAALVRAPLRFAKGAWLTGTLLRSACEWQAFRITRS